MAVQVSFNNNIVNFNLVTGGFTKADIVGIAGAISAIPGSTPLITGVSSQVILSVTASDVKSFGLDPTTPPGAAFDANEGVDATGVTGGTTLLLTGHDSKNAYKFLLG